MTADEIPTMALQPSLESWEVEKNSQFDIQTLIKPFQTCLLTFLYVVSPVSSTRRWPSFARGVKGFLSFSLSLDVKDCVWDILTKNHKIQWTNTYPYRYTTIIDSALWNKGMVLKGCMFCFNFELSGKIWLLFEQPKNQNGILWNWQIFI